MARRLSRVVERQWQNYAITRQNPLSPIVREAVHSFREPYLFLLDSRAVSLALIDLMRASENLAAREADGVLADGLCALEIRFRSPFWDESWSESDEVKAGAGRLLSSCVEGQHKGGRLEGLGKVTNLLERRLRRTQHEN